MHRRLFLHRLALSAATVGAAHVGVLPALAGASGYQRDASVAYAYRHALNYNQQFPRFKGFPGANDSANFASQVAHAGGIPMSLDPFGGAQARRPLWYAQPRLGAWQVSSSWADPRAFRLFLDTSGHASVLVYQRRDLSQLRAVAQPGDFLQIVEAPFTSAWHTMVVTRKTARDLFLTYHSSNTIDRPLREVHAPRYVLIKML